jgi:hypothetical protein
MHYADGPVTTDSDGTAPFAELDPPSHLSSFHEYA